MAKLIDADNLRVEGYTKLFDGKCTDRDLAFLNVMVDEAPTIDAIPVVRCRDCAFCLFGYQCLPNDEPTKPDNYCWKGRREDATD